jgi:drug/metabolite transporter (DMT)-like permease
VIGITISDTLYFMALNRLGAGMNAVVACVYAPTMTLMAVVFLDESPTVWILVGGSLILTGILVGGLTRPGPGREKRDLVTGFAYGVAAMVTVAVSVVILSGQPWFKRPENLIPVTTVRLMFGSLLLLPPVLLHRRYRAVFQSLLRPSRLWAFAVPASILGGALAMLLWLGAFTLIPMTTASVLNQFSTIYIFILATVVLKEPLTKRRAAAIALALGGAIVVTVGSA